MIETANAKRCDITGEYFEPPKKKRRIIIQIVQPGGKVTTPDIGPTLYGKIEKLIGNTPIRKTRKKRKKKRQKAKAMKPARKVQKAKVHKVATKEARKRSPKMEFVMKRADKLQEKGMTRTDARKQAAKDWERNQKSMSKTKRDNEYMEKIKPKAGNGHAKRCVMCGDKAMTGSDLCLTCSEGCESLNGVDG